MKDGSKGEKSLLFNCFVNWAETMLMMNTQTESDEKELKDRLSRHEAK